MARKTTNIFKNPGFLDGNYIGSVNPMTYEGTINKTALSFILVLVGAALGWFMPVLSLVGILGSLVLGIIIAVKQSKSPGLILPFSAFQGMMLGAISMILEAQYEGIVVQAVVATFAVFAAILIGSKTKVIKTNSKLTKIVIFATLGYFLFSLVNLGMMLLGLTSGMFGLFSSLGPLGIAISILATFLASYTILLNIEYIQSGVENKLDKNYEWYGAYALVSSLTWLYIEMIRLLALFRN